MLQLLCLNWDILHSVTTLRFFSTINNHIIRGDVHTWMDLWGFPTETLTTFCHGAKANKIYKKKRQLHSQQSFCWISNNNPRLQTVIKLHFFVCCFECSMENKYFVSGKATTEVTNSSLHVELNLECKYEILRLLSTFELYKRCWEAPYSNSIRSC